MNILGLIMSSKHIFITETHQSLPKRIKSRQIVSKYGAINKHVHMIEPSRDFPDFVYFSGISALIT